MPFDLESAKPVEAKSRGFDLESARPAGASLVDQIPDMPPEPKPGKEPSWWQKAYGTGEAALSAGLGMVAAPVGSAIGLAKGLFGGKLGTQEGVREASDLASKASAVTPPQTEAGREKLDQFGRFIESTKIAGLGPNEGFATAAMAPFAAPQIATGARAATKAVGKAIEPDIEALKAGGRAVAKAVTPSMDPEKAALARKAQALGIDIRPDMLSNSKFAKLIGQALEAIPLTGAKEELRQEAFNRAMIGLIDGDKKASRLSTEVFSDAFNRHGKTIGDTYARTNVPLGTDAELQQALSEHLTNLRKETADVSKIVTSFVEDIRNSAENGVIPGTALRKIRSEIGEKVRNSPNGDLRSALHDLQEDLTSAVKRQLSPEEGLALDDASKKYAIATKMIPMVADSPLGDMSPSRWMQAMTSSKASKRAMALDYYGESADLARIGKLFLKEPSTSLTTERRLVYGSLSGLAGGVGGYFLPGVTLPGAGALWGGANAYNRLGPALARKMTGYKPGSPKFKAMVESTGERPPGPSGPPSGPQSGPFGGSGMPPVAPQGPGSPPAAAPPDTGPFGSSGLRPAPAPVPGAPVAPPPSFSNMLETAQPGVPVVQPEQRWDGVVRQPGVEAPKPPVKAYSPEVQGKLDAAAQKYRETVEFYKRNTANDPDMLGKKLKGAGMDYAKEKREITGELTAREVEAKKARDAGNYLGKEVSVDGLPAKVTANPFGRVKVEFEDGRTMTVDAERIKPPGAEADPALMLAGLKPPKVTSLLQRIKNMGGIDPSYAPDLTGESGIGNMKGVPRGFFVTGDWKVNKAGKAGNGWGLDDVATALREDGWDIPDDPIDGGVGRLSEMIRDEIAGKKSYSLADEERVGAYERDVRMFQEAEDAKPIASELKAAGLEAADEVDATLVARAAEIDEGAFERLTMQFGDDDAGFMQGIKEIIDGANKGAKAGEGGEAGAGAQAFGLEGETEAQIRARETAQRLASEKAAQQSRAPSPQDFLLSGRSSPADEAAARGQTGFSDFLNSTRDRP